LSVREALRIQTVPDEYILPEENSLKSKFKMICNGVPCKMSKCMATSIADFLRSSCDILKPQNRFFVGWYKKYGRKFPWRRDGTSPFEILITEMLLRQTKADMVSRIWYRFTKLYPNPEAIVKTNKNRLKKIIQELGFGNQRTHALKEASQYLLDNFQGNVPDSEEELLKIPHVGLYTARATLCFAFGQKVPIVDLNVIRFFGRYYGINLKLDNRKEPFVWERAKEILPYRRADTKLHNYGMLDFNGLVCKPVRPDCTNCMLRFTCSNTSGQ
jgi:A/G-specific adenine glycosylase